MFTTPEEVMTYTPYEDVTIKEVMQAQFVIEIWINRVEGEIEQPRDKELLGRAVIAQTVYMRENPSITFEQVAASSISRGDAFTTFKAGDFSAPFIAPLAVMACRSLSWNQSRSVHFGRIWQKRNKLDWRRD